MAGHGHDAALKLALLSTPIGKAKYSEGFYTSMFWHRLGRARAAR
jgi:hypothetical protein